MAGVLSDRDLDTFRALLSALAFTDDVTITDPGTPTDTDSGGSTITGATTTTTVGRLVNAGGPGFIRTFGEQLVSEADRGLRLPYETDIHAGWTVEIRERTYTVTGVVDDLTDQIEVKALLKTAPEPIGG